MCRPSYVCVSVNNCAKHISGTYARLSRHEIYILSVKVLGSNSNFYKLICELPYKSSSIVGLFMKVSQTLETSIMATLRARIVEKETQIQTQNC